VATGRLAAGRGGLSGRALWPGTPKIVAAVRGATGGELAVNASGGVFTAEDVRECLDAGATTVQIYTSFVYRGPAVVGDLTRGILRD
jgi:dihydroorotate dehydrogenase